MRLLELLAVALLTIGTVSAQTPKRSFDLGGLRLPSAEDLVEQIGNEADTRLLVSLLLQDELSRRQVVKLDRVRLFSAQVRPEWLPSISGLEIDLLDDSQARAAYEECKIFFALQPAGVRDGAVSIPVSIGNRCFTLESYYEYRYSEHGWHGGLAPAGGGSGASHCGCPPWRAAELAVAPEPAQRDTSVHPGPSRRPGEP